MRTDSDLHALGIRPIPPKSKFCRFHPTNEIHAIGLCKPCYAKHYHQKNRKKVNQRLRAYRNRPEIKTRIKRWRPYKLSGHEFRHHLSSTHCEMCRVPFGTRNKCIDHDHSSGKVRGSLCSKCNSGLGLLGDNVEGLCRALHYLTARFGGLGGVKLHNGNYLFRVWRKD
jgi:hypothetical protein